MRIGYAAPAAPAALTSHLVAAVRINRAGGVFSVLCAFAVFYTGSSGIMTEDTTWVRLPLGEFAYAPSPRRCGPLL